MKNAFLTLKLLLLSATAITATAQTSASQACNLIQAALPGKVFYPGKFPPFVHFFSCYILETGTETYLEDIAQFQTSSQQNATCAVNPDSVSDLSTIVSCPLIFKDVMLNALQIKIIGRDDIRSPFAVSLLFLVLFPAKDQCRSKAVDILPTWGSAQPLGSRFLWRTSPRLSTTSPQGLCRLELVTPGMKSTLFSNNTM